MSRVQKSKIFVDTINGDIFYDSKKIGKIGAIIDMDCNKIMGCNDEKAENMLNDLFGKDKYGWSYDDSFEELDR